MKKLSVEEVLQLYSLKSEGTSDCAIGKLLGLSCNEVVRYLNDHYDVLGYTYKSHKYRENQGPTLA